MDIFCPLGGGQMAQFETNCPAGRPCLRENRVSLSGFAVFAFFRCF
ncbi:hypothetical protein SCH4B_1524 [Ruegeria sp. TrichCH4B]|nr:hypothetical protein SCH4B_1524 [Ruegeria sp. TrichCH4B]